MKKLSYLIAIALFSFGCGSSSNQESDEGDAASAADEQVADEVEDDGDSASMGEAPPDENEIGVPYYPGAKYMPSSGTGHLLIFASEDSKEKVMEFYKDKLEGWVYDEKFRLFHSGSAGLDYNQILQTQKTVMVGDYPMNPYKTSINITYPVER